VPIGASDFSASGEPSTFPLYYMDIDIWAPVAYSLDDTSGDTSFNNFNINRTPSYVFSVLKDIMAVNPTVKVHIVPWSPVRIGFNEVN
jgi:hypothetical protein